MSFLFICCKATSEESKRNSLFSFFFRHTKSKYILEKFFLKKLIQITPIEKYEISGLEVKINCTVEELEALQVETLEFLFEGIRNLKGGNNIVLEPELEKLGLEFISKDVVCMGDYMSQFFVEKLVEKVIKKKRILKKNLRIVIVDGAYLTDLSVLLSIVRDLNYCTVITTRTAYFEGFVSEMYEEYGLVVEVEDVPCNCRMHGQLVLDFQEGITRNPKWFPKEAEVICFEQRYTPTGKNWSKWEYYYQKEIILATWLELLWRDTKASFDNGKWLEIKENIDITPAIGYNTVIVRGN